ncbi:MAG TPA: type II toxin-antitoxin system HicB family antitoxin [Candidatus Hydrogenedentes bacterium]|nr:type II toxin-antitoxin system HicB family antitoxin [Candidatus Hydrogenedentota bacterium]HOS03627.1 type II toxin-antitoxin system HicB family antitoxin [Candidatus Hydrogenedentota bacterium]
MHYQFTGVFRQVGSVWVGTVEEIPHVTCQAASLEETREMLKGAIRETVRGNRTELLRQIGSTSVIRENFELSV